MTTIQVKNARSVDVQDYSTPARREQINQASREQVRSEEQTLVRRLMRARSKK